MKSKLIFAVLIGLCVTLTNCNTPQEDDEYENIPDYTLIYRKGALCIESNPFDATDSVLCFNEYPHFSDVGQKSYETEAEWASKTVKFILLNKEGKPISIFDSTGVRMDSIVTYWDAYDWITGNRLDSIYSVIFCPGIDFLGDPKYFEFHIYRNRGFFVNIFSPEVNLIDSLPCYSPNGPIHAIQKPVSIISNWYVIDSYWYDED